MRTSVILASALATTVLAGPVKRDEIVVTDTDIVYVTDYVTVTAGQVSAAAYTTSSKANKHGHHSHHHHHSSNSSSVVPTPYSSPAPITITNSYSAPPAPAPTTESSPAPAPAPTSYSPVPAPAPTSYQPAPAPSSYSPPPPSSTGVITNYQQAVVDHHNYHRANHSAPAIEWDQGLADIAMQIVKTCDYQHQMGVNGASYGQNIAAGNNASAISIIISDQFYNGEVGEFDGYGQANPDMSNFEKWGHFSQVVWASTTKVGCATWKCDTLTNFDAENSFFTTCNYSPPGNFGGEYGANIGNSLGKPTIPGDYNVDCGAIANQYDALVGESSDA